MEDYICISMLNDFIFCPYSIYLHNIYMDTDEMSYHATPQIKGKTAHESIDKQQAGSKKTDLVSMPVFSERFGLMGKIDIFKGEEKLLIERKYQIKQIYLGQKYQLWGQYLCMREMGFDVERLAFYDISRNKLLETDRPNDNDICVFEDFIESIRNFDLNSKINISPNKCRHCIYCSLCDKTEEDNVYQERH